MVVCASVPRILRGRTSPDIESVYLVPWMDLGPGLLTSGGARRAGARGARGAGVVVSEVAEYE